MDFVTLILQIAVILVAARLTGWIFRKFHQPQVVGEMTAGLLLGPSLFGRLSPALFSHLFPTDSLSLLGALSQVGLLLFMFLVGLELDLKKLRSLGRVAVVTSHVSIAVPFILGVLLALLLYPRLSDGSVRFTAFALFMGAAMSVTAFPVLARILTERKLLSTEVGTVAVTCAAVDDVTAWCILAAIVALVRSTDTRFLLLRLSGLVIYVVVMLFVVRRFLRWMERSFIRNGVRSDLIAGVIVLILISSLLTELLGVHALFGAFVAGVVAPKDRNLIREITSRFEPLTVVMLLPIFFVLTGLRTSVSLISGASLWLYCGLIILVAVAGKFGGSMISARANGMPWRESAAVGVLMNTRGLVELVILNIGLDMGILSPTLFSMMVLMALATTFMATPILQWIYPDRHVREFDKASVVA